MKIISRALQEMVEHCSKEYPNEGCGYLAGRGEEISQAYPIRNSAASPTITRTTLTLDRPATPKRLIAPSAVPI